MGPPAPGPELRKVTVVVAFGDSALSRDNAHTLQIEVAADGSDTLLEVKEKISRVTGGNVTPGDLLLSFGANDRKMGQQFRGDPTVDETKLRLSQYSALAWMERFPHWTLAVRPIPNAPPPPGVAIKQAAAIAERKDPERAVQDGRAKGEVPMIKDLPAPWGPKPYVPPSDEELMQHGYLPATYPSGSAPLVDA